MVVRTFYILSLIGFAAPSVGQNTFPAFGNAGIGTINPKGALHILEAGEPLYGLPTDENGLLLGTQATIGYKWIQSYGGVLAINPRGNNLAIGKTSATHKMDVNGAARVRGSNLTNILLTGSGDDSYIDLIKQNNNTTSARIKFDGYTNQNLHEGNIAFLTKQANSTLTEKMRINANGTIKIGEQGQLQVGSTVSMINPRFHTLRSATRSHACILEHGGGWFSIGNCLSEAEYAPMIDTGTGKPDTGDLVVLIDYPKKPGKKSGDKKKLLPFATTKSTKACDSNLIGFVSNPELGASGKKNHNHDGPLAFSGYFPVKVTMENGPIKRGDPITSSTKAGYGMKSTDSCKIVGYALEDKNREGTVLAIASLGEYPGKGVKQLEARIRELENRLARIEKASRLARFPAASGIVAIK